MITIEVSGWKENHVGWTGWDPYATSEFSKRLRRSVNASPQEVKRITRALRTRSTFVIKGVHEDYLESLRQILETMGAVVAIYKGDSK